MSSNGGGVLSDKDKNIDVSSNFEVSQLNQAVQDVTLDAGWEGGWEVISKKNKNRAGTIELSKQWGSQTPKPNPWGQPLQTKLPKNVWASQMGGRTGSGGARVQPMIRDYGSNNNPAYEIPPPLQSGWNWSSRPARKLENDPVLRAHVPSPHAFGMDEDVKHNDETEEELDLSNNEFLSDEHDSDEMPKSHEEMKKNKWCAAFLQL